MHWWISHGYAPLTDERMNAHSAFMVLCDKKKAQRFDMDPNVRKTGWLLVEGGRCCWVRETEGGCAEEALLWALLCCWWSMDSRGGKVMLELCCNVEVTECICRFSTAEKQKIQNSVFFWHVFWGGAARVPLRGQLALRCALPLWFRARARAHQTTLLLLRRVGLFFLHAADVLVHDQRWAL